MDDSLYEEWRRDFHKPQIEQAKRDIEEMGRAIVKLNEDKSDGYHTFDELYYHRTILFSVICNAFPSKAWKSKMHEDGTMYPGYFIAGIETPSGTYGYHCELKYWDKFKVKHFLIADEFDGYLPADIERLYSLFEL